MDQDYQINCEDRHTTILVKKGFRRKLNFQSDDQELSKNIDLEAGNFNRKRTSRAGSEFFDSKCPSLTSLRLESIMSDFNQIQPIEQSTNYKQSLVDKINGVKPQISSEKKFLTRRLSFIEDECEQNFHGPKKIRLSNETSKSLDFEIKQIPSKKITHFEQMIPTRQGYFSAEFETIGLLGEGHNGRVYLSRKNNDSKYYAVKSTKIPMKSIQKTHQMVEALNEIQNLSILQSQNQCHNLVQLHEFWREDQIINITLEYCEKSLSQIHQSKKNSFTMMSENEIKKVLFDVLIGLQHIHNNQLVHLDIKPENILYSASQNLYKITDFGMSRSLKVKPGEDFNEGDSRYSAEELLNIDISGSDDLTSADIFSLGATLYELITNQELPSRGPERKSLRSGISLSDIRYSGQLKNLVIMMMHPDPKLRPKITDILCCEYFINDYIYYQWRQLKGKIIGKELKKLQELIGS